LCRGSLRNPHLRGIGGIAPRSALNGFCQMHDVKNAFVVDGAAFTTASEKNPTLTILALVAGDRLSAERDEGEALVAPSPFQQSGEHMM
jgi:choline dehydrogenase-like flavoprotein